MTVTSAWRVMGASVAGTSHQRAGLPCQDAHAWRLTARGAAVLVVADGAGSAARSDAGAAEAANCAADVLAGALESAWPAADAWPALFDTAYAAAAAAVADLAASEGLPARDFACTLLCAALAAPGQPGAGLAVAQLGDGVAVLLPAPAAEGEPADWEVAAAPQRGEYANETYFLSQPDVREHVQVSYREGPVRLLAVMTDGLLRLVLDLSRNQPFRPFFEPLQAFSAGVASPAEGEAQLAAFLASDRVCARTDDDKTLLLAARVP